MILKSIKITDEIEAYLKDTTTPAKSEAAIIREAIWASREFIEWELNREVDSEDNKQ